MSTSLFSVCQNVAHTETISNSYNTRFATTIAAAAPMVNRPIIINMTAFSLRKKILNIMMQHSRSSTDIRT